MDPHSPTFKLIFGILGNIIGVGVNLAPMVTFWNIYKKRDSQEFSGLPYAFSLFAALIWVLYGLPNVTAHALFIVTVNVIGSAIQILYLMIFLRFATKKRMMQLMKVMGTCFVLFTILTVLTLTVVPPNLRTLTVGSVCVVIGVITYASPLSVGGMVIRTRSVKFLPIVLCMFLFINSTVWSCYGIITRDRFVLIPNTVGVVFGVAQISLYAYYRNATPIGILPEKGKTGDVSEKGKTKDVSVRGSKDTIDENPFDKPREKPLKDDGKYQTAAPPSQVGNNGTGLPPTITSHASPSVNIVRPSNGSPNVIVIVHVENF